MNILFEYLLCTCDVSNRNEIILKKPILYSDCTQCNAVDCRDFFMRGPGSPGDKWTRVTNTKAIPQLCGVWKEVPKPHGNRVPHVLSRMIFKLVPGHRTYALTICVIF